MQLDWLLYYIEVVNAGTISAAAQNLHVSSRAQALVLQVLIASIIRSFE